MLGRRAALSPVAITRTFVSSSILRVVFVLGALLFLPGIAGAQPCQGTVGSTTFDSSGAVTVTTTIDINTALRIATTTPCTSVISIGAAGTFQLSQPYIIPLLGGNLTLQAGSGLGATDVILQAASGVTLFTSLGSFTATKISFTGGGSGAVRVFGNFVATDCLFSGNVGGPAVDVYGTFSSSGCTFAVNSGAENGGAVRVGNGATYTDNRSTFRDNHAFTWGGAVFIDCGGNFSATYSTFTTNLASGEDFASGGAVAADFCNGVTSYFTAVGCTFEGNTANGDKTVFTNIDRPTGGGALWCLGECNLSDCTFTSNRAPGNPFGAIDPNGVGGGAIAAQGYVVCTNCLFTSNYASRHGGAVLNYNQENAGSGRVSYFTCYGCDFESNRANQGGGIWSRVGGNGCDANNPSNLPCAGNGLTLTYNKWWGNSVSGGSYQTQGSNIFTYATNGCWCTYLSGTSPPGGGINNPKRCTCNPAGAPSEYEPVATGKVFANCTSTPLSVRMLTAKPAAEDAGDLHRELFGGVDPNTQACYKACSTSFSPSNGQFFFNVIGPAGSETCQCCEASDVLVDAPDGRAFAGCISDANLMLVRKIRRTKVRPGKTLTIKATVRVRDTATPLKGLMLAISFPQAYMTVDKTHSRPRKGLVEPLKTTANLVTWPQFDLAMGTKRTFRARFRVSDLTPPSMVMIFETALLQTAGASAPYCLNSIGDPAEITVVGRSGWASKASTHPL